VIESDWDENSTLKMEICGLDMGRGLWSLEEMKRRIDPY